MRSLSCEFLNESVTVLCDGTVTCGLDDPFKVRVHGNAKTSSIAGIFNGPLVTSRRDMLAGGQACRECSLYKVREEQRATSGTTPILKRLVLEPSIKCNIRCDNMVCNVANDPQMVFRQDKNMSLELFAKIIDEVGPGLEELLFYNYGEPFANPKALDMLAYAKKKNPNIRVITSTNGILLAKPDVGRRIVEEGLVDWICFTIGGCDEETYRRYHKAGSFAKAVEGMAAVSTEKARGGLSVPIVHWRYLLFNWNDQDEHIVKALRLKEELGVDEFRLMLSYDPIEGRSLRRAPGTLGHKAISEWIAMQEFYEHDAHAESGLWPLEDSPGLGPFCWTSRSARLLASPAGGVLAVRLSQPALPTLPPANVIVRAPWAQQPGRVGFGEWHETTIPLPSGYGGTEVEITIEVDRTINPFKLLNTPDHRELGVMISMEGVSPVPNPFRMPSPLLQFRSPPAAAPADPPAPL